MEGVYKTLPYDTHCNSFFHCNSLRVVFKQCEPSLERLKGEFTLYFWYQELVLFHSTWFIFVLDTVIHVMDHVALFVSTARKQRAKFTAYIYKTKSYTVSLLTSSSWVLFGLSAKKKFFC